MALGLDKVFGIHEHALRLRAHRTELLASNIANADTPNYKAKDIDFQAALNSATNGMDASRMKTTHPSHISGDSGGMLPAAEFVKFRVPHQPSLDGNTVENHVEQAEFAKNALQYQATLQFVGSRSKGIQAAIKGRE